MLLTNKLARRVFISPVGWTTQDDASFGHLFPTGGSVTGNIWTFLTTVRYQLVAAIENRNVEEVFNVWFDKKNRNHLGFVLAPDDFQLLHIHTTMWLSCVTTFKPTWHGMSFNILLLDADMKFRLWSDSPWMIPCVISNVLNNVICQVSNIIAMCPYVLLAIAAAIAMMQK